MKVFELGSQVEDVITGFRGVVVGRIEYLNGCVRYQVQPRELKDGKSIEPEWIDVQQLRLIDGSSNIFDKKESDEKKPGGPGDVPSKMSVPRF